MESNKTRYGRLSRRHNPTFHSLAGYVDASYDELVKAFGVPTYVARSDESVKTAISWALEDHVTGASFSVYEWKSTTRYSKHPSAISLAALRRLPTFRWHIAAGRFDLDTFQRWLSQRFDRNVVITRE